MMKGMGYKIIHYGVEGAESEADEQVDVMTQETQNMLRGHDGSDKTKFYADDASTASQLYKEFNRRLKLILAERVTQSDLVLLPLGHAHWQALDGMPYKTVELGVGYPELYNNAQFRIFESYAWMHWQQGKEKRWGRNYEWVIPNYFNLDDWSISLKPESRLVVFLGRIGDDKGLPTIVEIAKHRPNLRFVICGQGDPKPYLTQPNVIYMPPISGTMRSLLLGAASAVLMPSVFTEPFAGVSVEAQLCGTPVISTSYGGFTETIEDQVTGFRCHTLGDFLVGLDRRQELDRIYIAERARFLYGYDRVKHMYDRAFQQIKDLQGAGWYSTHSVFQRQEKQWPRLTASSSAPPSPGTTESPLEGSSTT